MKQKVIYYSVPLCLFSGKLIILHCCIRYFKKDYIFLLWADKKIKSISFPKHIRVKTEFLVLIINQSDLRMYSIGLKLNIFTNNILISHFVLKQFFTLLKSLRAEPKLQLSFKVMGA